MVAFFLSNDLQLIRSGCADFTNLIFSSFFAKFGRKNGLQNDFKGQHLHWLDPRINLRGPLFLYDGI